jgi:hypothetical protein
MTLGQITVTRRSCVGSSLMSQTATSRYPHRQPAPDRV